MKQFKYFRFASLIFIIFYICCGNQTNHEYQDATPTLDLGDSTSTTISGIRVVTLSGTRRELGYAHGYLLANEILDVANNYIFKIVAEYENYGLSYDYIRAMVDDLTYWDSGSIEELEGILAGIIDALGSEAIVNPPGEDPRSPDLLDLKVANSLPDWMSGPQCSGFAVWGDARSNKGTLHARNLDYFPGMNGELIDNLVLFVFKSTDEGRSWISISWPGFIGCTTCINENSMSIAMHDVGGEHPSVDGGFLTRAIAARRVITQTEDIADAEILLEEYPVYYAGNFHVALPSTERGDDEISASFELGGDETKSDGGVTIRSPSEHDINKTERSDYLIVTNHWLKRSGSLESFYVDESKERYRTIKEALENEISGDSEVNLEDAVTIMKTVEADYTGSLTIYSSYFAPDEGLFWLSVADDLQTPAPESTIVEFRLDDLL